MNSFRSLTTTLLALLTFFSTGICIPTTAHADENQPQVRKLDPRDRSFHPVQADQIIPGKIYNRFDQELGQYVWAYAKEEGGFSYPLGPGTTELPENFDLVTSESQTQDIVVTAAGNWAKLSSGSGQKLMVRLQAAGAWEVLRTSSVRSHFDLKTGRRWQWNGPRKVPVKHTAGSAWRFEDGWYVPATSWRNMVYIYPTALECGCVKP